MFINLYSRKFTIFLADVSPDMQDVRQELEYVLANAGIKTIDGGKTSPTGITSDLKSADCSIHLLGATDIYTHGCDGFNSPAGMQFRTAKNLCSKDFKMFVWNPAELISSENAYINNIRRDIVDNIVYSDRESPIIFVEDIRNIMNVKQQENRRHESTDIFFLYNELDSDTADGIFNMLKDFQRVERLGISISSGIDYNAYILDQLAESKIGVVYYDYAGDWAVSFARQIWKDSGGNSSHTPIFIIGNSQHANIKELSVFNNIMEYAVNEQLRIPLDIKVFLDKHSQK